MNSNKIIFWKAFIYSLFVSLLFFTTVVKAQPASDCDGDIKEKARKLFKQALGDYSKNKNYATTKALLDKAIAENEDYYEAYLYKARLAFERGDDVAMEEAYKRTVEICPDKKSEPYRALARLYFKQNEYKQVLDYVAKAKTLGGNTPQQEDELKTLEKIAQFRYNAITHPVPFNPVVIDSLSTEDADEYLPMISPDGDMAFYTRRIAREVKGQLTPQTVEEFSYSYITPQGYYNRGDKLPKPFNQGNNEGGCSISIDNNDLYFTICKPDNRGYVNCDIYYSRFSKGQWGPITNLGSEVNGELTWESQPSIAPDGRTLYFATARPGCIGGSDIYKSEKDVNGRWQKPVNLGPSINTAGNEKSPFMHADGHTMYFASDSLLGMGGYDMYVTHLSDDEKWDVPANLGYPINTEADELGFFVSTNGVRCYFASNKLKGNGGWDIFGFDLYERAKPEKVLFVKGQIASDKPGNIDAVVEFKSIKDNSVYQVKVDSVTGKYASAVRFKSDYVMSVKTKGGTMQSKYFAEADTAYKNPVKVDFKIQPIAVGQSFTINDVFFATASFELNEVSRHVLAVVVDFMKENPTVKLGVYGHTDNVNDTQSNQLLSENRAKVVFDYLVLKGVVIERLTYKGFGESKPIATNETPEGRAKNRRTEFVILAK